MSKQFDFRDFLEDQIKKGKNEWSSRSELIRFSGNKANGLSLIHI